MDTMTLKVENDSETQVFTVIDKENIHGTV